MADKKKELKKVRKTVRFDTDMVTLIKKKSKQSGKPFSEVIRRAVKKDLVKPKRAKDR